MVTSCMTKKTKIVLLFLIFSVVGFCLGSVVVKFIIDQHSSPKADQVSEFIFAIWVITIGVYAFLSVFNLAAGIGLFVSWHKRDHQAVSAFRTLFLFTIIVSCIVIWKVYY